MWGEINGPFNQRTPTSILHEQASILSQLIKDVLIGSIEQESTANNILIYNFAITAPAINNHKFAILTLQYSITIYPLTLTDHTTHVQRQCLNEAGFTSTLKSILSSTQVKRIISALLIQSRDNKGSLASRLLTELAADASNRARRAAAIQHRVPMLFIGTGGFYRGRGGNVDSLALACSALAKRYGGRDNFKPVVVL